MSSTTRKEKERAAYPSRRPCRLTKRPISGLRLKPRNPDALSMSQLKERTIYGMVRDHHSRDLRYLPPPSERSCRACIFVRHHPLPTRSEKLTCARTRCRLDVGRHPVSKRYGHICQSEHTIIELEVLEGFGAPLDDVLPAKTTSVVPFLAPGPEEDLGGDDDIAAVLTITQSQCCLF